MRGRGQGQLGVGAPEMEKTSVGAVMEATTGGEAETVSVAVLRVWTKWGLNLKKAFLEQ